MSEAKSFEMQPDHMVVAIGDAAGLSWHELETTPAPGGFICVPVAALRDAIWKAPTGNLYIKAAAEPTVGTSLPEAAQSTYTIASDRICISPDKYRVEVDGQTIDMTLKTFGLLHYLGSRADTVCKKPEIYQSVWNEKPFAIESLDVHLSWLRKKLGEELGNPLTGAVRTLRGVGLYAVKSLDQ